MMLHHFLVLKSVKATLPTANNNDFLVKLRTYFLLCKKLRQKGLDAHHPHLTLNCTLLS